MILEKLTLLQIIFLIAVPVALTLLVIVFIVIPVNKRHQRKHFGEYCYKAVYRIAFDEDFYLINDFKFRPDPATLVRIDHILFGNKYIYVISSAYFDGDLTGKESDASLILVDNKDKKYYTDNCFKTSKSLVKYLSVTTGISESMFVGVVVVNNDCKLCIDTNNKFYYLIQRRKLKRLIRAIESRNVKDINATQLEAAVKAIDKINRTKKK